MPAIIAVLSLSTVMHCWEHGSERGEGIYCQTPAVAPASHMAALATWSRNQEDTVVTGFRVFMVSPPLSVLDHAPNIPGTAGDSAGAATSAAVRVKPSGCIGGVTGGPR